MCGKVPIIKKKQQKKNKKKHAFLGPSGNKGGQTPQQNAGLYGGVSNTFVGGGDATPGSETTTRKEKNTMGLAPLDWFTQNSNESTEKPQLLDEKTVRRIQQGYESDKKVEQLMQESEMIVKQQQTMKKEQSMFNKGLTLVGETLEVIPRFFTGNKDETTEKDKENKKDKKKKDKKIKKNDKNKEKNDNLSLGSSNDSSNKQPYLKKEGVVGTVSESVDTMKIGGKNTLRMKEKEEVVGTRIKRKKKQIAFETDTGKEMIDFTQPHVKIMEQFEKLHKEMTKEV